MNSNWDCIVVGGGAAGLSATLVLGRARRRTLLVDAGAPSNLASTGIGGLLGHNTRAPGDFYAGAREEVAAHPTVELRSGEVVAGERDEDGFVLELADGTRETAKTVLLATGMDYRYPALAGIDERWGDSVFHCPFCHGWEHRDAPLGVLDRGVSGAHRAQLLLGWSDDVTLLTDGPADLEPDDAGRLAALGVAVDERQVAGLDGPGRTLTAVRFEDGAERPLGGLLVPVSLHQRSGLAEQLGAAVNEPGPVVADGLAVDAKFATSVPGLFAAGDLGVPMPSVANAISSGHSAAGAVVQSLMAQPQGLALGMSRSA